MNAIIQKNGKYKQILLFICITFLLCIIIPFSRGEVAPESLYRQINIDIPRMTEIELSPSNHSIDGDIKNIDIDRDGFDEIIFTENGHFLVYSVKNDTYNFLFPNHKNRYATNFLIFDINFDNIYECLAFDLNEKKYVCLEIKTDIEKWSVPIQGDLYNPFIDIFKIEKEIYIVLQVEIYQISIFNEYGILNRSIPISDDILQYKLFINTINGDTNPVILLVTKKVINLNQWNIELFLYDLIQNQLKKVWNSTFNQSEPMINYLSIVDIEPNDRSKEIIIGIQNYGIWILKHYFGNVTLIRQLYPPLSFGTIKSVDILTTINQILISCSYNNGIYILDWRLNTIIWRFPNISPSLLEFQDVPVIGRFNILDINPELLFAFGSHLSVINVIENKSVFNFDSVIRFGVNWHNIKTRYLIINSNLSTNGSLHIFLYGKEQSVYQLRHIVLFSIINNNVQIRVEPAFYNAYPKIPVQISDISISNVQVSNLHGSIFLYSKTELTYILINNSNIKAYQFDKETLLYNFSISQKNNYIISIEFILLINWSVIKNEILSMDITLFFPNNSISHISINNFIQFTNQLEVNGELILYNETNTIASNSWLISNMHYRYEGLSINFVDSYYSPNIQDIYISLYSNIIIKNNISYTSSGKIIGFFTIINEISGNYTLYINISTNLSGQEFIIEFNIKIDSINPYFEEFSNNDSSLWYSSKDIDIYCIANDGNGSGIKRIEIIYFNNLNYSSGWIQTNKSIYIDNSVIAFFKLTLPDGIWNFRWRIFDNAGNGPVLSMNFSIRIDRTKIIFSHFIPQEWQNSTDVLLSLDLSDYGGSGINLSTIEYSIATNNHMIFTEMINIGLIGTSESITIQHKLRLNEGIINFIRYRAVDNADNVRYSNIYQIRIDISGPIFYNPYPSSDILIRNADIFHFSINIKDILSGLNTSSVEYIYKMENSSFSQREKNIIIDLSTSKFTANISRIPGNMITIIWYAQDNLGSISISEPLKYYINTPPVIVTAYPISPYRIKENENVHFNITILDFENDNISIKWLLNTIVLSQESDFNHSFREGFYNITLEINDNQGNQVEQSFIIIVEEDSKPDYNHLVFYLPIFVIIIIILSIIFYIFKYKHI